MARLLKKFPGFKKVITTTSRKPRAGEVQGHDYNFISEEDFRKKIKDGDFIEYVEYAGNLYGTEKNQLISKDSLIWRIDPSRAGKVKGLVIYLTVSDEVVLQRLKKRGLSQEEITKRMQEDQEYWQQYKDKYDFVVENIPGQLDQTIDKISRIIESPGRVLG